jgi:drug/metabolite transporter (DMT)-like permease
MFYYLTIALTVISNVFYHVFLKLTPNSVNPILSLTVTYATAMLATLIIYPFYPTQASMIANFKSLNWASFALGMAIVGLEIGFILAYRLGWPINMAGVVSNISVSVLLIPIGLLFFRETISAINLLGLLCCIVGLILVNYKS